MPPDGWSEDSEVARWEAVEAEARARVAQEAREADGITEGPGAHWDAQAATWWADDGEAADPAGPDAPGREAPAPDDGPPADPTAGADILVADADYAVATSLQQAMADRGWIVRRVENGEAALAEFRRDPPDCFVLDYALPGPGGLDLLRRLAEAGVTGETRIVVNSTHTQTVHIQRARALGAHRFLERPRHSPDEVVEAVAGQLAARAAEADPAPVATNGAREPSVPPPAAPAAPAATDGGLFGGSPPPTPAPTPAPTSSATPGGLFGAVPAPGSEPVATPAEDDEADEPEAATRREPRGRPTRSAFGSGGGPPGRVPKLG